MTRIRVMTYNILGGRHRRELAKVIRSVRPDVLVANESPKLPLLWRSQCGRLSADWDLAYVAGGRPAGSNLVVATPDVRVVDTSAWRIPQPRWQPRRGIVTAALQVGSAGFGVVGCHLSLRPDLRRAEIELVIDAAARFSGPVLVAGDLNERPDGHCWARLAEAGFLDAAREADLTFPASRPDRRIDALLIRGGVLRAHQVPELDAALFAGASDHLPVTALLEL